MERPYNQNFENHGRIVFVYHRVLFLILGVNLAWCVYRLAKNFSVDEAVQVLLAVGLVILTLYARIFALQAQDRVIRLEETLRMERLLPADLKARMAEFSQRQIIALRFASDAELPEQARRVLDQKITDGREIKRQIKQWKPDFHRL